jgi:hypothetical protein
MKLLGVSALIMTVLSFLFWLINWSYWTFLYSTENYDAQQSIRYVMQGISVLSVLTNYLAVLLICIGLILAAKRLPKI